MAKNNTTHVGGCLCGGLRFEAGGAPIWVGHCHCHSCRRNTGGPVATFVGWAEDGFRIVKGTPRAFASSPGVRRSFCPQCGTPLSYQSDRFPGEVHVYISAMDRPEDFVPTFHVYASEGIPWFHIADDLPRYARTSKDGEVLNP